jgi:hypothetical protein
VFVRCSQDVILGHLHVIDAGLRNARVAEAQHTRFKLVEIKQKRRTTVKRILSVLFVLAVVMTTTSTVYAQCSNATLNANYAFTDSGFGTPIYQ